MAEIKRLAHAIRFMEQAYDSAELLYKRADINSQTEPRLYIWRAIGDDKVRGSHAAKEYFGNFNYGATGKALGCSERALLRMAGVVQSDSKPEWGYFL